MWDLLWIPVIFSAGVLVGCWWAARPDDVCRMCRLSFNQEISELKKQIHGLKSSKGALGRELQAMAFRNAGYKAR